MWEHIGSNTTENRKIKRTEIKSKMNYTQFGFQPQQKLDMAS